MTPAPINAPSCRPAPVDAMQRARRIHARSALNKPGILRAVASAMALSLVFATGVTPLAAQTPASEGVAALTVEVTSVKSETWPETIDVSGKLAPWQEVIIASEIAGSRIVELNADVGQSVKKGEVLARLETADLEAQIAQQEAQLAAAQASLTQASQNAGRARSLRAGTAVSQKQVDEAVAAELRAQAEVKAAEAGLAVTRLNLARTEIVALDDGIITSRSANLGAVVALGTELFCMLRQGKVEWQLEVPLRQMPRITEGTKAEILAPNGMVVPGVVRLIAAEAAQTTGRVKVFVTLDPPADAPQPKVGMLLSGRLIFGETEAKTIPASAVVLRDGYSYVFVLGDGDRVERRRVEIGRRSGDRVEVLSGVDESERLVASGGAFLSDGALVRVVEGAAT